MQRQKLQATGGQQSKTLIPNKKNHVEALEENNYGRCVGLLIVRSLCL